ncbi:hypothetical protein [Campylobacter novaezeelandiae]|uniref:hypothetical protein n=1 Tax=Campylobacter novaezeelandiae TaxID=2267891 RepID=UPI00141A397E|nr:hypothetical protein [Campylobacter novaezeelandiae]
MKYMYFFIFILFSGCFVNERGISNRYYSDCKEYYDASGIYHKECPNNWVDIPLNPK